MSLKDKRQKERYSDKIVSKKLLFYDFHTTLQRSALDLGRNHAKCSITKILKHLFLSFTTNEQKKKLILI